jgi:iron complex transport system ATP-binding protein
MTAVLALRDVTVHRERRTVLAGVDLAVHAGELLVVVGPNGSGKSTLLAVLAGDLHPSSGTALLEGRPLRGWSVHDLARRRTVVVQQSQAAFGFTARDVVRMGRAPWSEATAATEHRVDAALDHFEAQCFADRPVHQLSGGERARIDLARALAQDTPIVLLDEPTAALDLRHAHTALTAARQLARLGHTVVAVVHDLALAAAYADRIALLHKGELAALGSPETVLTAARLSEVYGHQVVVLPHPIDGTPLVLARPGSAVTKDAEHAGVHGRAASTRRPGRGT